MLLLQFTFSALTLLSAMALADVQMVFTPRCRAENKKDCGGVRLESGDWKKLVTCTDDHEWHYIIEENKYEESKKKKIKDRLKCQGTKALAGPEETACKPYKGELSEFKKCTMFEGRPFKLSEP